MKKLIGDIHHMVVRKTDFQDNKDYYSTPPEATRMLCSRETFQGEIYEPCCGDGAISKVLIEHNYKVVSLDLINRGYGTIQNFLDPNYNPIVPNIITNPPYEVAEQIVEKAYKCTTGKVAMLLKLPFLSSIGRYALFRKCPLSRLWIFSRRICCAKNGIVDGKLLAKHGLVEYCWYIWDKNYSGPTILDWFPPYKVVSPDNGKDIFS